VIVSAPKGMQLAKTCRSVCCEVSDSDLQVARSHIRFALCLLSEAERLPPDGEERHQKLIKAMARLALAVGELARDIPKAS